MAIDLLSTRPYSYGSFSQAIDRLFDQALGSQEEGTSAAPNARSIPVNIWESNDGYHAAFLAAGLNEETLNVMVHEDQLTVEGELQFQLPEGAKPIWREFGRTQFRRSLRVGGDIKADGVEAIYRNGLLLVTLPKAEHTKPRQVQVKTGG